MKSCGFAGASRWPPQRHKTCNHSALGWNSPPTAGRVKLRQVRHLRRQRREPPRRREVGAGRRAVERPCGFRQCTVAALLYRYDALSALRSNLLYPSLHPALISCNERHAALHFGNRSVHRACRCSRADICQHRCRQRFACPAITSCVQAEACAAHGSMPHVARMLPPPAPTAHNCTHGPCKPASAADRAIAFLDQRRAGLLAWCNWSVGSRRWASSRAAGGVDAVGATRTTSSITARPSVSAAAGHAALCRACRAPGHRPAPCMRSKRSTDPQATRRAAADALRLLPPLPLADQTPLLLAAAVLQASSRARPA